MKKRTAMASRRDFFRKGLTGLVGIAIAPAMVSAEISAAEKAGKKQRKIERRTLGKTKLELPVVSMGVMNADNPDLVRAALDAGIGYLDTANYYQRGRNEEMIGGVLKGRPRDSFAIGTKVLGSPLDRKTGLYSKEATAEPFIEKFETSLKRLGLDHVEILFHHNVVRKGGALHEPYLTALQELKKQGKARFVGVSTHMNEPEVIRAAIESGVYDVVLTAYNFRQPHVTEVEKAIAEANEAGQRAAAPDQHEGRPQVGAQEQEHSHSGPRVHHIRADGARSFGDGGSRAHAGRGARSQRRPANGPRGVVLRSLREVHRRVPSRR